MNRDRGKYHTNNLPALRAVTYASNTRWTLWKLSHFELNPEGRKEEGCIATFLVGNCATVRRGECGTSGYAEVAKACILGRGQGTLADKRGARMEEEGGGRQCGARRMRRSSHAAESAEHPRVADPKHCGDQNWLHQPSIEELFFWGRLTEIEGLFFHSKSKENKAQ